jgi:hypothetical protein
MADENTPRTKFTQDMLKVYGQMLTWLFGATVLVVLAVSIILVLAFYIIHFDPPILAFIALSGALGGFISSLSRLYGLNNLPALLVQIDFKVIPNRYVAMYSLIPPVVGIVGAVVVYIAIAGGIVSGSLFASFGCHEKGGDCNNGILGLLYYGPDGVEEVAKALVWGFISGFSERFFPGLIENLSNQNT